IRGPFPAQPAMLGLRQNEFNHRLGFQNETTLTDGQHRPEAPAGKLRRVKNHGSPARTNFVVANLFEQQYPTPTPHQPNEINSRSVRRTYLPTPKGSRSQLVRCLSLWPLSRV